MRTSSAGSSSAGSPLPLCNLPAGAWGPVPGQAGPWSAKAWPAPGKSGERSTTGLVAHEKLKRRLQLPPPHPPLWP
eukprot:14912688-Alexandrium_andersonii.AAC.1